MQQFVDNSSIYNCAVKIDGAHESIRWSAGLCILYQAFLFDVMHCSPIKFLPPAIYVLSIVQLNLLHFTTQVSLCSMALPPWAFDELNGDLAIGNDGKFDLCLF